LPITVLGAGVLSILATIFGGLALAKDVSTTHSDDRARFGDLIREASRRFSISEIWIREVMHQESGGIVRIVSPKGAVGLMQVMPATYFELARRYRLRPDPFNPRDNILAGTAYLREMLDRFRSPGFLAAYNAGPRRYEQHLSTGRPLPDETIAYMANVGQTINNTRCVTLNRAKNLSRIANYPLLELPSRARIFVDLTALAPPTSRLLASRSNARTLHADGLSAARSMAEGPQ
jgi:hypothetical protein